MRVWIVLRFFLCLDVLLVTKPKSNLVCQARAGQGKWLRETEREREREKAQQATCADAEATADTAVRWLDCLSDDDTLSYTRTHTNTHSSTNTHSGTHTHTHTGRPAAALGAIIKVSPRTQPPHSGCNGFCPSLSLFYAAGPEASSIAS